jgi:hypothetical protein
MTKKKKEQKCWAKGHEMLTRSRRRACCTYFVAQQTPFQMLVTEGWNTTYLLCWNTVPSRGTRHALMQVEGHVTDTCAATLDAGLASSVKSNRTGCDLTGWQTLVSVGFHSSACHSLARQRALIRAPAFCFFVCGSNPTGAANMVPGVLITVASRGSPWSALCTLCLQRRDACESRSKGTQGVAVYTACLWTASTPGSIHAMPAMPPTPKRHARLHCGLGLMPAHITERR